MLIRWCRRGLYHGWVLSVLLSAPKLQTCWSNIYKASLPAKVRCRCRPCPYRTQSPSTFRQAGNCRNRWSRRDRPVHYRRHFRPALNHYDECEKSGHSRWFDQQCATFHCLITSFQENPLGGAAWPGREEIPHVHRFETTCSQNINRRFGKRKRKNKVELDHYRRQAFRIATNRTWWWWARPQFDWNCWKYNRGCLDKSPQQTETTKTFRWCSFEPYKFIRDTLINDNEKLTLY